MLIGSVFGVKCCHTSFQGSFYFIFLIITTCRVLLPFDWMKNAQSHGMQALNRLKQTQGG